MGYLKKTGFKEGHCVWKFVAKDRVIYRNRNSDAWYCFSFLKDETSFEMYVRTGNGWEYAGNYIISDHCGCGRHYEDNPSGEAFRHSEPKLFNPSIIQLKEAMAQPVMCMYCYYAEELRQGRWAPRSVKQALDY